MWNVYVHAPACMYFKTRCDCVCVCVCLHVCVCVCVLRLWVQTSAHLAFSYRLFDEMACYSLLKCWCAHTGTHIHTHSFISLLVLVSHYFCLYQQYELVSFYLSTYHCVSAIDSENVSRSKLLFGIEWDSPCMALFHWECICHRQCLCLPCHCTIENVSVIENVFLYIPIAS